jgi:serine/threonine protein kinase
VVNVGRPAHTQFPPGALVAGYRIEARIGRGGMATVYRAHDERLGRTVALKILVPALAADEEFRARFIRESRAAAATDHPNIIPVFEAGESNGVLFIAMRFVRGGDLRWHLSQSGPLAPDMVADIVSQTASALDAAHKRGLVHRDIKPGNLLLEVGEETGRPDHVYLSDFGLSKDNSIAVGNLTALTVVGQMLGTLEYMAPEQIAGRSLDGRADQYGLACTAYELLCGIPPFGEYPNTALIRAHRTEAPPRITSRRPDLPRGMDAVFTKALAKDPGGRYGSCREFAAALRAVCGLDPYRYGRQITPARYRSTLNAVPSPAGPRPPDTPPGGPGYPAAAPTIRRGDIPASAKPADVERTEVDHVQPSRSAAPLPAPAQPRRRWLPRRGRRGPGGMGGR